MYLLDEVGVEGDVFYGGGEVAAGVVHQAWEEGFLKLKSKQKYFAYKNFFCNVEKFKPNLHCSKIVPHKSWFGVLFLFQSSGQNFSVKKRIEVILVVGNKKKLFLLRDLEQLWNCCCKWENNFLSQGRCRCTLVFYLLRLSIDEKILRIMTFLIILW